MPTRRALLVRLPDGGVWVEWVRVREVVGAVQKIVPRPAGGEWWEASALTGMTVRAGVTRSPAICCGPFIPIGSSHDDGLGVHRLGLRSGQRESVRKNEGVHVQKGCLSWGLGRGAPLLSRAQPRSSC